MAEEGGVWAGCPGLSALLALLWADLQGGHGCLPEALVTARLCPLGDRGPHPLPGPLHLSEWFSLKRLKRWPVTVQPSPLTVSCVSIRGLFMSGQWSKASEPWLSRWRPTWELPGGHGTWP